MAWLLRKPPLPCHRGGGTIWLGGGGVGVPAHIYIYIYRPYFQRHESHLLLQSVPFYISVFLGAISSSFWLGSRTWITLDPDPEMPGGLNGKPGGSIHRSSSKISFFFLFSCEFLQHRFFGIFLGSIFEGNAIAKTQRKLCWSPSIWFRFTRLGP